MTQQNAPHNKETYEDFSMGDWGVAHPRQAKAGQFHAKNMVVLHDGTLAPRNGLIEQPLEGAGYVNGALNMLYFGVEHELATPRMVYGQDVTPRYFEVDTLTAQNPGHFTGPGGAPDPFVFASEPDNGKVAVLERLGFNMYWSPLGDNTYLVNALNDEVTTLTGTNQSFGAHDVIEYLDQVYLIGIGDGASGRGHKVTYSAEDDPTTWPVENIFLVGYAWVLGAAIKFQNGLLITSQDFQWWLLQGSPEDGSLRSVAQSRGPGLNSPGAVQVYKDVAHFIASDQSSGAFPCTFDGSELDTETFKHLRGWLGIGTSTAVGGMLSEADGDILFVDSEGRALMRHENVWTRHEFEVPVGRWASGYQDQRFYLAVDGDDTHKPVFYRSTFQTDDHPAIADGEWQSPGDGDLVPVDAWVEFPELYQPDNSLMRPMGVVVEFTSYDTGASVDPHFEVEVDTINRFGQESVLTQSAGEWDESETAFASSEAGVRRRVVLRALDPKAEGSGLMVRVKDIRGVKFERIVLDYEMAPSLDRT